MYCSYALYGSSQFPINSSPRTTIPLFQLLLHLCKRCLRHKFPKGRPVCSCQCLVDLFVKINRLFVKFLLGVTFAFLPQSCYGVCSPQHRNNSLLSLLPSGPSKPSLKKWKLGWGSSVRLSNNSWTSYIQLDRSRLENDKACVR
eukprot:TRINITY_DN4188_c0_g1_i2.p1 TRINITY_DN4188_c0_g1~~TRINITY_DN4188_c0_g1_i2.p1  ORF type:complete len:144 (+),score=1.99 TRINITY_DN4188_c0_g1_i2:119-550(+)